jgi:outer membrane receptor protein involved in Fe transport
VLDSSAKAGWLFGTYLQDEWKITDSLTLNAGLRFDQMLQYVDANQLSPRASLTWKPYDGTTFHAGYARNFTPPSQVLAAPTNLALVQGTTQQPAVTRNDPVLPERSHVFDVGVDQKIHAIPGLEVGIDAYYKTARDLLDDGQFGAAYVLTAFNYDRAENMGLELKSSYTSGNFRIYGNLAWAKQIATNIVSNQFLFAPDELAFIASHYIYTDHAGRRVLPMERHALFRLDDLRQRQPLRFCQYRSRAVLHAGQSRHLPRISLAGMEQADHAAVRRRQPV